MSITSASTPARKPGRRCSTTSRSSIIGNGYTRPSAIAPRPRRGPAWRGSPCSRRHDVLIPPLHSPGGSPVVMTLNNTLSIPNALHATRPEDYDRNAVTLGWPDDARGRPLAIYTGYAEAVAFRDGGHAEAAEEFARLLVGEGWLAHWLDFAADRWMPPIRGLLEAPFWLDPG